MRRAGVAAGILLCSLSCRSDEAFFSPPSAADAVYWRLKLNYQAVNLSVAPPYDTLRLVVTSQVYDGTTFVPSSTDTVTTTYISSDSSKVSVSADGLLRAHDAGSRISIRVSRQIGNVTHVDTALVNVALAPDTQPLSLFRVRFADSTKRAQSILSIPVTALDHNGNPVTDLIVRRIFPDTNVAQPFRDAWGPTAKLTKVGTTFITATTWRYGVVYTDTFTLRITRRLSGAVLIYPDSVSHPGTTTPVIRLADTVGVGGDVSFTNKWIDHPIDIIFDDETNILASPKNPPSDTALAGNLIGIPSDTTIFGTAGNTRSRRIRVAGIYPFTIVPGNTRGAVVIRDE